MDDSIYGVCPSCLEHGGGYFNDVCWICEYGMNQIEEMPFTSRKTKPRILVANGKDKACKTRRRAQ